MSDLFAEIADDYESMFPRDTAEDARMLLPLLEEHSVRTVLDCACGTGLHVAMLENRGFEVTGSDASEAMLDVARHRKSASELQAPFVQAEWHALAEVLPVKYDAVICIGNSLPLAGGDRQVRDALAGMLSVVAPGGVLIIQGRNMDKMAEEKPEAIVNPAEDGYTLFLFEYRKDMVIYKISYVQTEGDDKGKVMYNEFPMNLLTRAKFERLVHDFGEPRCRFYGDSSLTRFSASHSPRMIVAVTSGVRS